MSESLAAMAALLAWFGAVVLVLSDARRGLAVGILLAGAGLGLERSVVGQTAVGAVLFGGGLLAAVLGLRRNPTRGWGLLGAGSTPRVVLCIVVGTLAFYFGWKVIQEPADWQARVAVLAVGVLGAARMLSASDHRATLSAASMVALSVGLAAALTTPPSALVVSVGAALLAAFLSNLPSVGEVAGSA